MTLLYGFIFKSTFRTMFITVATETNSITRHGTEQGLFFFSTPKCLFLDRRIGPSCFWPRHVFFSTSSFFSAPQ